MEDYENFMHVYEKCAEFLIKVLERIEKDNYEIHEACLDLFGQVIFLVGPDEAFNYVIATLLVPEYGLVEVKEAVDYSIIK